MDASPNETVDRDSDLPTNDLTSEEVTQMHYTELLQKIRGFHLSEKFSDTTIELPNGYRFMAHRCMLLAQNSEFFNRFLSDERQDRKYTIKLPEMCVNVFAHLLHFIYAGEFRAELSRKLIEELSKGADLLQLNIIKHYLETLNEENC